ncbi:hypothetical protein ABTL25_20270, partial [Acinetobacter baumannii]
INAGSFALLYPQLMSGSTFTSTVATAQQVPGSGYDVSFTVPKGAKLTVPATVHIGQDLKDRHFQIQAGWVSEKTVYTLTA